MNPPAAVDASSKASDIFGGEILQNDGARQYLIKVDGMTWSSHLAHTHTYTLLMLM
jgi:hypothetical protein